MLGARCLPTAPPAYPFTRPQQEQSCTLPHPHTLAHLGPPTPPPHTMPGTLLVASEGLENTVFRQSVVLLYEHGRGQGAKGIMLTQVGIEGPGIRAWHVSKKMLLCEHG